MVSDASPLIVFARVGRLDLLSTLYVQIIIPPVVHNEVTTRGSGAIDLAQATWLSVRAPANRDVVVELQRIALDPGECEAIALAAELDARLLLDEYHGRLVANQRGITITGTVGIVVSACQAGLIAVDDVEPLLRQMVRVNFRISEGLIRHAVAAVRARH